MFGFFPEHCTSRSAFAHSYFFKFQVDFTSRGSWKVGGKQKSSQLSWVRFGQLGLVKKKVMRATTMTTTTTTMTKKDHMFFLEKLTGAKKKNACQQIETSIE